MQTLVPAGYLIPISQQSLISYNAAIQDSGRESSKASTPTHNIYQTPTAGRDIIKCSSVTVGRQRRKEIEIIAMK